MITGALISIQILFGVGYIFSKLLVESFPPLIWACIRSFCAALSIGVIALVLGRPHPKLNRQFFFPLLAFALLGGLLTQGLFLVGLRHTTSTHSSVIFTLTPIFTLMVVIYLREERLTPQNLTGFVFSFLGILILTEVEKFHLSATLMRGDLLTLGSACSYGLFIALSKNFFKKFDSTWITFWIFLCTGIGLAGFSFSEWETFRWPVMTPLLWILVTYGILGATLLSYFLVIWTIAHASPSKVALFSYLQPVLVSLIAYFFLGEGISPRTIGGSILILMGVGFTLWKPDKIQHK